MGLFVVTCERPGPPKWLALAHTAGGDATWLRSPLLPKPFILELLDFILNASAELFRTLHDFESAVTGRVSSLDMN